MNSHPCRYQLYFVEDLSLAAETGGLALSFVRVLMLRECELDGPTLERSTRRRRISILTLAGSEDFWLPVSGVSLNTYMEKRNTAADKTAQPKAPRRQTSSISLSRSTPWRYSNLS